MQSVFPLQADLRYLSHIEASLERHGKIKTAFEMRVIVESDELLERLLKAHEVYYDVQRDYKFAGRLFPGYAEFHTHGEKFVLLKKAKLWEVDAHEYLFFFMSEQLTRADLQELIEFMTTQAIQKVQPIPDHMTSYLSLVIITQHVDANTAALLRRTRFRKNYCLGFRGWVDLRLAAIELETMQVYTNGQGKELKKTLEANVLR